MQSAARFRLPVAHGAAREFPKVDARRPLSRDLAIG
jgi:hypothetical protein